MIYFLQPVGGGPVKIGTSGDLDTRHANLQSYYGEALVLLGTMPGGRAEEREIHARFAHLRIGRTEQFRPAPDLMEFIGRPLLVDPNPDAVEAMQPRSSVRPMYVLKGSEEYGAWLKAHSKARGHSSVAETIEIALANYAKATNYPPPPPRWQHARSSLDGDRG